MANIKERRLRVLNETVAYYSEDVNRRCSKDKGGGCYYAPESVNKVGISDGCAVGRLLKPELRRKIDGFVDKHKGSNGDSYVDADGIFNQLPKSVQLLGKDFLVSLQTLHDKPIHWLGEGLSTQGLKMVELIKEEHKLI